MLQKYLYFLRTNFNAFSAIWGFSKRPSPTLRNFLEQTKLFILKILSDVRNSEVRCASVSPTDLHGSPPSFSYFAKDILRLAQRYSLLTCQVAQTADQLAAFLRNLANFYQTARCHCQMPVLPITRSRSLSFGGKHVHKVLGCDTVWSGGYVRIFCRENLQSGTVSLNMEAEIHSAIFVPVYQIIRRHIAETSNPSTALSVYMPTLP